MVKFNKWGVLTKGHDEIRYAGIDKYEYNNGIGIGVTLFTQFCSHQCLGCHNPETWDKEGGEPFTKDVYEDLLDTLADDQITRLTLSGGDPLDSLNLSCFVASNFKKRFPNKQLWVYTGYTFEHILENPKYNQIIDLCDILVDGEFDINKKDLSLAFRGSANQRIIDVKKSLAQNNVVLWKGTENEQKNS